MRSLRARVALFQLAVVAVATLQPVATHASVPPPNVGKWTLMSSAGAPTARFGAMMGYHFGSSTSAMFGGCAATTKQMIEVAHIEPRVHSHNQEIEWCSQTLGDTKSWSLNGWTTLTSGGPPARYAGSLSYDYGAGALVLFGGGTWTVSTEQVPAAPAGSERCLHAITYLKILSGPDTGKYLNFWCFSDTWYLRKVATSWTWQQKFPTARPPARFDGWGANDRDGHAVVGGGCSKLGTMRFKEPDTDPSSYYFDCFHRRESSTVDTTSYRRDAWVWNDLLTTWTRAAANSLADQGCRNENTKVPTCRRGVGASYNPNTEAVFNFGGFFLENTVANSLSFCYNLQCFSNDPVWQFRNEWLRTCRSEDLMCNQVPPSDTTPGVRAFSSVATAYWDGAWRPMVFAGYGADMNNLFQNDLWAWHDEPVPVHIGVQKGTWSKLCPTTTCTTTPSRRASAAMTYMPGGAGHLVAFGGRNQYGTILGDTWVFGAPSPPNANPCLSCVVV